MNLRTDIIDLLTYWLTYLLYNYFTPRSRRSLAIASPPSHSLAVAYSALLLSRLSRSCAVVYSALLLSRQLVSFFALASPFYFCVSLTPTGIMLCPHTLSVAHSALCLPPTQPVSCVSFYLSLLFSPFSFAHSSLRSLLSFWSSASRRFYSVSSRSCFTLAVFTLPCSSYVFLLLREVVLPNLSGLLWVTCSFGSAITRFISFCLWLLIWPISSLALLSDFLSLLMFFYGAKRRHRREAPPQARSAAAGAKRRRKCLLCFISWSSLLRMLFVSVSLALVVSMCRMILASFPCIIYYALFFYHQPWFSCIIHLSSFDFMNQMSCFILHILLLLYSLIILLSSPMIFHLSFSLLCFGSFSSFTISFIVIIIMIWWCSLLILTFSSAVPCLALLLGQDSLCCPPVPLSLSCSLSLQSKTRKVTFFSCTCILLFLSTEKDKQSVFLQY